ncbi:hypothetical protein MUGA111182_17600 [Mucilaginibacter galii]|uniref:hypothetical protein n=1 Tax=Mucilaginibacter galii TaxID=2005073 RepID=UPI001665DC85|nr:hypothetical protein [Mucilaginibacter galii]
MNKLFIIFQMLLCIAFTARSQTYIPQWSDKRMKVKNAVPVYVYPFSRQQLKLLNSPFNDAMHIQV